MLRASAITSIDGAYEGDGGPASAIYDATVPYAGFTGNPSLNNYGQAAFLATLDNGVSGLFLGSGGEVTTVADDTAQFISAFGFSDPSLNERGEVAFRAGTNTEDPDDNSASTGEGIFLFTEGISPPSCRGRLATSPAWAIRHRTTGTGRVRRRTELRRARSRHRPDFVDDRVIGTDDQLLGRSINGLVFSREGNATHSAGSRAHRRGDARREVRGFGYSPISLGVGEA